LEVSNEENLCIICKCDDEDGDNGPMGYLGHVQRSRVCQLASKSTLREFGICREVKDGDIDLDNIYRVVGDKGCQVRFFGHIAEPSIAGNHLPVKIHFLFVIHISLATVNRVHVVSPCSVSPKR